MSILFQLTFSDLNVCTVSNSTHTWIGLHHFVLQTSSSLNIFKHWATPIFLKKSKQFFLFFYVKLIIQWVFVTIAHSSSFIQVVWACPTNLHTSTPTRVYVGQKDLFAPTILHGHWQLFIQSFKVVIFSPKSKS